MIIMFLALILGCVGRRFLSLALSCFSCLLAQEEALIGFLLIGIVL